MRTTKKFLYKSLFVKKDILEKRKVFSRTARYSQLEEMNDSYKLHTPVQYSLFYYYKQK